MSTGGSQMLETLRRRSAAARTEAVARASSVRTQVLEIVRGQLPAGGRAWLVGSLAWGEFGTRSDVDLVFDGVDANSLLDLEIAVGRAADASVDVLQLCDLSAAFRDRVEREGLAIHGP
jgi:predicted nucleotidyltransferase